MANAEQISEEEIGQFHNALAETFATCLQLKLQVGQADEKLNWKAALTGTRVFCIAKPAAKETLVDFQDGECLFRLSDPNIIIPLWVSWGEQWIKSQVVRSRNAPKATLDLIGVQLCFHVGNSGKQKTQILRAEWDNPNKRGEEAAQPHWHIDPSIGLPLLRHEQEIPVLEGLEELPSQDGFVSPDLNFLSLQRLHLGMAGWKHRQDHPQCWQHKLDLDTVTEWLGRVLVYCKSELPKVTIR